MPISYQFNQTRDVVRTCFSGTVLFSEVLHYWENLLENKQGRHRYIELVDASRLTSLEVSEKQYSSLIDAMMNLHQFGYIGSVVLVEKTTIREQFNHLVEDLGIRYKSFGSYLFICDRREDFLNYGSDLEMFLNTG